MAHRRPHRAQAVVAGLAVVLALAPACRHRRPAPPASTPTTAVAQQQGSPSLVPSPAPRHPRGGVARVAVWEEPDPTAATLEGAAVRALTLPQLFVAEPDGSWAASLAQPFTDRTAADARSATVALRPGAVWSDGSPITADDLRRSADTRFVAGIDGPSADGTITIRFTQPLPGWHRLWSGVDTVSAPRPGVWGGPFVVQARTPGLEVVLARNDRWYAGAAPFLDEVHLVLVPDSTTARQLLAKGDVDVVAPPAATVRTPQLRAVPGVTVETGTPTGWWVGLQLPAKRLDADRRRAVVATVDRERFVSVLLAGEATPIVGFGAGGAGPWAAGPGGDAGALKGRTIDLVGENEEPMTSLLQRSMQLRARAAGGELELRNAEADRVEGWLAAGTYDAAIVQAYDGPQPCWVCRWGGVDAAMAARADAGDEAAVTALQSELRGQALLLPLWRPVPVVAHRPQVGGVRVNGYGLDGAWDAWEWFRG